MKVKTEFSTSPCIQEQSFGFDASEIWVDDGCRAEFLLEICEGWLNQ